MSGLFSKPAMPKPAEPKPPPPMPDPESPEVLAERRREMDAQLRGSRTANVLTKTAPAAGAARAGDTVAGSYSSSKLGASR